jgi:hypothetical protein
MPRIACLGWGSLIWDPGSLPIQRTWFRDGPFLHVEFRRQSDSGKLTLVLDKVAPAVRSLWAVMDTTEVEQARRELREGCHQKDIHAWQPGETAPVLILDLESWAQARSIGAVIWTGLPPKKDGKRGVAPTIEEALQYLNNLSGEKRMEAEKYIRYAPSQIDTPFRRRIEAALKWTPRKHGGDESA